MTKTLLFKGLCFLALLAGLNLLYHYTLFQKDLAIHAPMALSIRPIQHASDVLYLGESSNATYAETDSTRQSISELTNAFFPALKIGAIDTGAVHAEVYKYWLYWLDRDPKPKAIVVTMNLRSFDAAWMHSKLEVPLQQSIRIMRPGPALWNRFLMSLEADTNNTEKKHEEAMLRDWRTVRLSNAYPFRYHTVHDWDSAMAWRQYPPLNENPEKIGLACHYIKAYAFEIKEGHPRLRDFDEIVDWCGRQGIPLVFNLMAENIQYADSLVGKDLVFLMKTNRDFLVKRYTGMGVKVADNLELVEGKDFIDQGWTTEHYNARGRMRIARNLAQTLKTVLTGYTAVH